MNQSTVKLPARPERSSIEDSPHELSRVLLEAQFSLVFRVRQPWRARRRDGLCDFMAVDADLRTWWIASVEPSERLSVLLSMMTDKRLARQVAEGDHVQLHTWIHRSGELQVEVVELAVGEFLCRK
jgi:hypothetical protein